MIGGGCHWLLGEIWGAWKTTQTIQADPLTFWKMAVNDDRSARLWAEHDVGHPPLWEKTIEYTDFPLDSITLYLSGGVLMLPGEY